MRGLTDKFAQLQNSGRSRNAIVFEIFRDIIFFPAPLPPATPTKLKVFVAGFARSGTGSLAVALSTLGYNPCHGPGTFELAPILAEHYAGRASHSDLIRYQEERGFDAQGFDMLGWKLWKEALVISDPSVKFILTDHPRGGAGWAQSWSSFAPDFIDCLGRLPFRIMESMVQFIAMLHDFLSYVSDGRTGDPRDPLFAFPGMGMISSYEAHRAAVIEAVPADRLLVFKPTEGWAPLCNFLEVEESACPTDMDYPRMTDRQLMKTIAKMAMVVNWIWPLIVLGVIAVVVSLVYRACFLKGKKSKQD